MQLRQKCSVWINGPFELTRTNTVKVVPKGSKGDESEKHYRPGILLISDRHVDHPEGSNIRNGAHYSGQKEHGRRTHWSGRSDDPPEHQASEGGANDNTQRQFHQCRSPIPEFGRIIAASVGAGWVRTSDKFSALEAGPVEIEGEDGRAPKSADDAADA